VARRTIRAEARSRVVRLGGGVVVVQMASTTSGGCARITIRMALDARGRRMRSVQWESGVVMIEGGVTPCRFIMAKRTILAEPGGGMIRFGGRIVVVEVAGATGGRCSGVTVRVALDTIRSGMCAVQREAGAVMIERRGPSRAGGVTGRTIRGETGGSVVRVRRCIEIRHVATRAYRGGICEVARGMAPCAILYFMTTGEREKVMVGEVGVPTRAHWIVTFNAVRGETSTRVVRVLCS